MPHTQILDMSSAVQQAAAGQVVLEARNLVKEFSGFRAVNGVSLSVRQGEIHALIGPNGAGKTTLFNLLTKFLPLTSGRIAFQGRDITQAGASDIARMGLVRSFQISSVFSNLSALDNVRVALQRGRGGSFDFWRSSKVLATYRDRAMELLASVDMEKYADHMAVTLPYGRKRALELATTLALSPRMMLLDEPMAGLAQEDIGRITELIQRASVGRAVLMVEHNLSVVASLSHRITVLSRGTLIAEGDYAKVSADAEVQNAYLGTAHA
jgi:branched-chain amino acid transport system ATP-binding protein